MKWLILPAAAVITLVAVRCRQRARSDSCPASPEHRADAPRLAPDPRPPRQRRHRHRRCPELRPTARMVAPATMTPAEMEPNDELFDAINRGDIAAARDAISRGADLSGRNVLGMTPMELSVDLGRNDISFLLLSMRGGDKGGPPRATIATTQPKPRQAGEGVEARAGDQGYRDGAAGSVADGAFVQRRWRHAGADCRLPGVRIRRVADA